MKKKQFIVTKYICEICNQEYSSEENALLCESRLLSQDKGVKVGGMVRVLYGSGAGETAKVTKVGILNMDYGFGSYWHTVYVVADLIESYGSRLLTYQDYALK